MNVYKIIDKETPYCGGMAVVAANNKEEALDLFYKNTKCISCSDKIHYTASLLENVIYNKETSCFITEEFYYE